MKKLIKNIVIAVIVLAIICVIFWVTHVALFITGAKGLGPVPS